MTTIQLSLYPIAWFNCYLKYGSSTCGERRIPSKKWSMLVNSRILMSLPKNKLIRIVQWHKILKHDLRSDPTAFSTQSVSQSKKKTWSQKSFCMIILTSCVNSSSFISWQPYFSFQFNSVHLNCTMRGRKLDRHWLFVLF